MAKSSNQVNDKSLMIWKRLFCAGSKWEDKDEFLDVIYWGRQIVSILLGIIWGFFGLTSAFGLISYMAVCSAIIYLYSIYVNNDSEDAISAVKEAFVTSLAAFLVTWILVYTYLFD